MSKLFEAEIEVIRLYTVKFMAENMQDATVKAEMIARTARATEDTGESVDYETNLVGVSRQVGRKMYQ